MCITITYFTKRFNLVTCRIGCYAHFIKDYVLSSKFPKTTTLILKCAMLRTSQRYMYYMWNMRNHFMYIHLLSSREKGIKLLTIKRVSAFTTLNLSRGHLKSRWKTIVPNSAQCYCSLPKTPNLTNYLLNI